MKYAEHIVDLVGNTPLVKLTSVTEGIAATDGAAMKPWQLTFSYGAQ